jgi:hypothetical protein
MNEPESIADHTHTTGPHNSIDSDAVHRRTIVGKQACIYRGHRLTVDSTVHCRKLEHVRRRFGWHSIIDRHGSADAIRSVGGELAHPG